MFYLTGHTVKMTYNPLYGRSSTGIRINMPRSPSTAHQNSEALGLSKSQD